MSTEKDVDKSPEEVKTWAKTFVENGRKRSERNDRSVHEILVAAAERRRQRHNQAVTQEDVPDPE